MELKTLKYQVMGNGIWICATVSNLVAAQLAAEYESYGWPVEVSPLSEDASIANAV
ncbi:hypothetical protein [Vibrio profundi]|uniref:hypothetical protein n=1 Tax=Vibrio profundi TaxID=1774960 RepID=UPI003735B530